MIQKCSPADIVRLIQHVNKYQKYKHTILISHYNQRRMLNYEMQLIT